MPRIKHILLSRWGVRWRKIQVVMFTVYLDDSGTSPSQHVAVATALVIPAKQIERLEGEWERFKNKEGFQALHFSEFIAKNPKSDFSSWSDEKQERIVKRVQQICKKYGTKAFSFAVFKKDYDEIVPGEWRPYCGQDHYSWALKHVMTFLDEWRIPHTSAPLEYVFDWVGGPKDKRQKEIRKVMERWEHLCIEQLGRKGDYLSYSFRHREDFAGLQCVDSIAWCCYQVALHQFKGSPYQKCSKQMFLDYVKDHFLKCRFVNRRDLQDWFSREIQHPDAIKWRDWMRTR